VAKNGTTSKGAWAAGAAFAAFSGAVALGWLYGADLWASRTAQEHSSGFLDNVLSAFSFLGSVEIAITALLVLLAGLFLRGRRALAGRILVIFVATGILELVMKFYLPQAPIPSQKVESTGDYAPLVAFVSPHSYPSGHALRSVIVFGALCLLSGNRFVRTGFLVVLAGLAASRAYLGVHWASDVVGGALLGLAALLWAFGKEKPRWRSR
jgi:undecaprenyl-diphosphatase